jgi:hypothetical protein
VTSVLVIAAIQNSSSVAAEIYKFGARQTSIFSIIKISNRKDFSFIEKKY